MQQQLLLNTLKVVSCCLSDFGGFIGIVYSSGFPWKLVQRRFLETGGQGFGHAGFGDTVLGSCVPWVVFHRSAWGAQVVNSGKL